MWGSSGTNPLPWVRFAGSPDPSGRVPLSGILLGTTPPVPDEATDNGFPSAEDVDVDALFAALREEIRRSGADP